MSHRKDKSKTFKEQYAQIALGANFGLLERARELGYSEEEIRHVPQGAVEMGLGCGNPAALAELQKGQVVLDLGSGAGLDAFIASQKVGPHGKVIGIDMTPEMVRKARQFAKEGRYKNVEFKIGQIENLPISDESTDVIISNCVINHSPDKVAAFKEALRVLRLGGMMLISDLVVEGQLPPADSPGLEVWAQWLTVASGKREYLAAMKKAGFRDITIVTECLYDGLGATPLLAGKIVSLQLKAYKHKCAKQFLRQPLLKQYSRKTVFVLSSRTRKMLRWFFFLIGCIINGLLGLIFLAYPGIDLPRGLLVVSSACFMVMVFYLLLIWVTLLGNNSFAYVGFIPLVIIGIAQLQSGQAPTNYSLPRNLRYFFVFLSPSLDALACTDFKARPSLSAASLVLICGNTFLSNSTSCFNHVPLTSFFPFAIVQLLSF